MKGKFAPELVLLRNGNVRVAGPFDPGDDKIDTASVLFLIVQGEGGPATVIVQGEASWKRDPNKGKDQQRWEAEVSATGKRAGGGEGHLQVDPQHPRVRGIAYAVAVQPVTPSKLDPGKFDPPAFESLTWCADSKLVAEGAS